MARCGPDADSESGPNSATISRGWYQWRYLPEGFPNWNTVYWYFARWTDDGTWERVNDHLRRQWRVQIGRDAEPSAGIIDSQSAKTTEKTSLVNPPDQAAAGKGGLERLRRCTSSS